MPEPLKVGDWVVDVDRQGVHRVADADGEHGTVGIVTPEMWVDGNTADPIYADPDDLARIPAVASTTLEGEHPTPQWRHVVKVVVGGRHMPMAACKSSARAAIVERALRLLAESDKDLLDDLARIPNNG
ncbi:MAG TPA: hypothetical protein VNO31_02320 [Umezawaea sp.]|nr:hypothetical protein [Umezawaea sp.]